MSLELDVRHEFGTFTLEAKISAGEGLTALFGHSGSGKTTLVNIIGGLLRPQEGRVVVDGRVLVDTGRRIFLPKHRRRVGYIFQEPRLFPHLTVRQNLLYGRWFRHGKEGAQQLEQIVDLLGIEALLGRGPAHLSGGEKQRVAIGRALLANPQLLLMDEPLAALDEARKLEILPFLERLRDELKLPIVYVSHSMAEVARLATTVVLMEQGKVVAAGAVEDVLSRVDLPPLGTFRGTGALLEMSVAAHDEQYRLTTLNSAAGELHVPRLEQAVGARLRLRILARDVIVATTAPNDISALNSLKGHVAEIGPFHEGTVDVRLALRDESSLVARITRLSLDRLELKPGVEVYAVIKSAAVEGEGLAPRQAEIDTRALEL
ncbi:MAG: molybdenum ABC transporter ATP-binding protein [Acidobacteriota bacterium]|nr:molybdenum ABC transporter ATP-binding protein [Acidobacteriota bacterium]